MKRFVLLLQATLFATQVYAAEPEPTPTPTPTPTGLEDGRYVLTNVYSGKVMEVSGQRLENGANISQWSNNGQAWQQWDISDLGNGYYKILSAYSGKSADVYEWNAADGAELRQWDDLGFENQQWEINQESDGSYNIISRYSGKSIEVYDFSTQDGGDIRLWAYRGDDTQKWNISEATNTPPAPSSGVIGFASQPGSDGYSTTTGGGNASPIVVTSCSALSNALSISGPTVIQIPNNTTIDCRTANRTVAACQLNCPSYLDNPSKLFYRVPVPGQTCTELGAFSNFTVNRTRNETRLNVNSNTTIEGLGANSRVVGGNFNLSNVQNVIIRNLRIEDVNPGLIEAGDGISMQNTSHIWLDHLSFSLISDGHVDMYDSQNVTLSWNRFNGYNPAVCGEAHHYTHIVQDTQATFHHNAYIDIYGRNPKVGGSASRTHIFNNFYKNVDYFAIGVSDGAQALVESNYFENAAKPHWDEGNGLIEASGNEYRGISASDPDRDSNANVFNVTYPYSLDAATGIPNLVNDNAGPR